MGKAAAGQEYKQTKVLFRPIGDEGAFIFGTWTFNNMEIWTKSL